MIFIPGKPRGKGRPRFTRGGGVYTDPQTKAYEQKIASEYHRSGGALFEDVPVKVFIEVRYGIPKSESRKMQMAMQRDKVLPTKKPDIDNVVKIVMDALNGVAYTDDKQVIDLYARKVYSTQEGVVIAVERWSA